MALDLRNAALLTHDLLADAARLFDGAQPATPAELHALNGLVEAAALHETLFVHDWPAPAPDLGPLEALFRWHLIDRAPVADALVARLEEAGLHDVAGAVEEDRHEQPRSIVHDPDRLAGMLALLAEYETAFGFERMSRRLAGDDAWPGTASARDDGDDDGDDAVFALAATRRFSPADVLAFDGWYRRARAATTVAGELGLHLYTGLLARPLVLGHVRARDHGTLQLVEALKLEFDDAGDSALPPWRRVEIPALTQQVLLRCKGDATALPNEIMRVRSELAALRIGLTAQATALARATTRQDKRRIRQESEASLAALIAKHDTTTRLLHRGWDVLKNPLVAHVQIGDQLVAKDRRDQAIDKTMGLSDLWALLASAPSIDANAALLGGLFGTRWDAAQWHAVRGAAQALELLLQPAAQPPAAPPPRP